MRLIEVWGLIMGGLQRQNMMIQGDFQVINFSRIKIIYYNDIF